MRKLSLLFLSAVMLVTLSAPAWSDSRAGSAANKKPDNSVALKKFRLLAEQGDATAQNNLGFFYVVGWGLPRDIVQAYMWFSLSAERGYERARINRDTTAKNMTPAQIAEAKRLAGEWKPKSTKYEKED